MGGLLFGGFGGLGGGLVWVGGVFVGGWLGVIWGVRGVWERRGLTYKVYRIERLLCKSCSRVSGFQSRCTLRLGDLGAWLVFPGVAHPACEDV